MKKIIILTFLGGLLAACVATPAVIADLEEDKVIVRSDLLTEDSDVLRKARDGCAIHDRVPVRISYTCVDEYCSQKNHLFACRDSGLKP